MAGVSIEIEGEGLKRLEQRLAAIADPRTRREALESVAAEIETQARRRIEAGGPAPDNTDWADWSKDYARTRRGGGGKLFLEGDLLGSLQSSVSGDEAEVGTNLRYGAIHQFGGAEVGRPSLPARPYLGLSGDDEADIEEIVTETIERLLRG